MEKLQEDWAILAGLFPAGWEEWGRESKAVARLRGFDSVASLLRVLLLHVGWGFSLRETAVRAKAAGLAAVSDVTLLNRLRQSEAWLQRLCRALFEESGVQLAVPAQGIRIVDGTVVKESGQTGSRWWIHYSLLLPSLTCDYFALTPMNGPQNGETLKRYPVQRGDLVLADRGFACPAGVAAVCERGGDLIVRLHTTSLPLRDRQGRRFALLEQVRKLQQAGQVKAWNVAVRHKEQLIPGRLCAIRKSEVAIAHAQRRLTRREQTRQRKAKPETREYACYVLVFTTLPASRADARQVLEQYRLRWQIELVFKRLKSLAGLGHVPKHDEQSIRAWLYGKLLVALLTQKLARIGAAISPWGYR